MLTKADRRSWQTTLVLALAASSLVVGLWYPMNRRHQQVQQQLTQAQSELAQQTLKTGSPLQLQQQIRTIKNELGRRGSQVPTQNDVPALLRTLSQLAESQQLGEAQIINRPVLAGDQYQAVPMAIQFKGPFPQAFGMLKDVESMERLLRVTRLDVSRDTSVATGGPANVNVSLELAAFFAPAAAPSYLSEQP